VSDAVGPAEIRDIPERWPVTASAELASGSLVRVRTDTVRMPGGQTADREIVEHPGAVAVLGLDESGRVLMIRQYRHPVGRLLWEIPAGLRDKPGEPLLAAAERELLEETGYRAAGWQVLGDFFTSPGFSTERIRIFLATGLTRMPAAEREYVRQHEEAHLLLAWVPLEQAVAGILAGDLHNGVAALGILSASAARQDRFEMLRPTDAPEC
jgi:8-oxo-dGTP pyrophosphatase MutT (NUDIX family)